jgi:hypothetical protein
MREKKIINELDKLPISEIIKLPQERERLRSLFESLKHRSERFHRLNYFLKNN